jgi:hypothetical protein
VALFARTALAEGESDVHLAYVAHGGCPSRDAFVAQVEARTNKARWVSGPEGARRFEVTLKRVTNQTEGRFVSRETDGRASDPRIVRSPGCDSVVGALALIAALAIDPEALSARPPPAPAPEPAPEPRPLVKPRPVRVVPDRPEPSDWKSEWRWSIGAQAGATSGIGSKLAAIVPVYVDVTQFANGWLEPSLRLTMSILPDRTVVHEVASAQLLRFAWQVSGCPVVGRIAPTLLVRPCAGLELGLLRAEGEELEDTEESFTPWAAATIAARVQVYPLDMVAIEAQAEAGVPFVRPRYVVEPDVEVVRLDPAYGAFTGGVGVRFP